MSFLKILERKFKELDKKTQDYMGKANNYIKNHDENLDKNEQKEINYKQWDYLSKKEVDDYFTNITNGTGEFFGFWKRYLNLKTLDGYIYSNELKFLKFINKKPVNVYISPYWEFNYLLFDVDKLIKKLIDGDYLKIISSKENSLAQLKVIDLQDLLKKQNLKHTGKKNELIKRIIDNNIYFSIIETYQLTTKGENTILENNIYFLNEKINYILTEDELYGKKDILTELKEKERKIVSQNSLEGLWGIYLSLYKLSKEKEEKDVYLMNNVIIGIYNKTFEIDGNDFIPPHQKSYFEKYDENKLLKLINASIFNKLPSKEFNASYIIEKLKE